MYDDSLMALVFCRNFTPESMYKRIKTAQRAMATPAVIIGDEIFLGFRHPSIEQALEL